MRFSKRIVSVILALVLFTALFTIQAAAKDFFRIESCDISAALNEDGTMRVSEIWSVSYVGQSESFVRSFDYADKANRYDLRSREQYNSIAVESVKVNGKQVAQITETAAGDGYIFTGEVQDSAYSLDIRAKAVDETKTYEIVYTVSGAVKAVGKRALVAFRFLGDSFYATANNVTLDVALPSVVSAADIALSEETDSAASKVDGKLTYHADLVTGVFSADFTVPVTAFSEDKLGKVSGMSDFIASVKKFLKIAVPLVLCVLLAVLIIYFVFFADKVRRRKLLKQANASEVAEPESEVKGLPETVTAVTAYKLLNPVSKLNPRSTARKVPVLFAYAVLECISVGFIREENGKLILSDPENQDIPRYIRTVLNFLMTFASAGDSGTYVIDSSFSDKIERECQTQYDRLVNLISTFYTQIPAPDKAYFKDAANVKTFVECDRVRKASLESDGYASYAKCAEAALSGCRYDDPQLMAMLYGRINVEKFFTCPTDHDSLSALSNTMLKIYNVYVKSK